MDFEFLHSVFPNYTQPMYDGNEPTGKGQPLASGGYLDRWSTKWGNGETHGNDIYYFSFNINADTNVCIIRETLYVIKILSTEVRDYCNDGTIVHLSIHRRPMPMEEVERIVSTDISNCTIWKLIQNRARELIKGDKT